ncbi:MAG TPA: hypothetical protein VJW73_03910 [Gemmatimonadaceae bacterium]|nr:hypothetical protein [Gemmatimonadaceae bacterium]
MWFTVLDESTPIGFVELASGALVAAPMIRLPMYERVGPTTRAATDALLQLGLFGGALPPLPPVSRELMQRRRSLSRAARLQLVLVDARGALAQTAFVNLLQSTEEEPVVLVAGFGRASAHVGAVQRRKPRSAGPSLRSG